ncbi:hypothetical protein F4679DRAFT_542097 [Xylaria curta]|nr:hypothetical protein F4679DRAFT_542097 [Xylaria curta]
MAYPNFPSSWSAPTTCFRSTNIWAVAYSSGGQDYYELVLGIPATTSTGDCLPPSYSTSVPYFGNSCPTGYRIAIASRTVLSNQQAQATLCCPGSDYSFVAAGNVGCQTKLNNDDAFIVTYTDATAGTQRLATVSDLSGYAINAFGITIISTSSLSSMLSETSSHAININTASSGATETYTAAPPPGSARLSAGAAAGIGIGAGLGVILVILAIWIMYRRRGKKTLNGPTTLNADMQYAALKTDPSPGISSPETGPGIQSPSYQPRQFDASLPTDVYGQHPSELSP